MRTKKELEMERTQEKVRLLKKELADAIQASDKAWREYIMEKADSVAAHPNVES